MGDSKVKASSEYGGNRIVFHLEGERGDGKDKESYLRLTAPSAVLGQFRYSMGTLSRTETSWIGGVWSVARSGEAESQAEKVSSVSRQLCDLPSHSPLFMQRLKGWPYLGRNRE